MSKLIIKLKALIKIITPWIKYGIKEYKALKAELKNNR